METLHGKLKITLETFLDIFQIITTKTARYCFNAQKCLPVGEADVSFWRFVVLVVCKVLFLSQFFGASEKYENDMSGEEEGRRQLHSNNFSKPLIDG